MPMIDVRTPSKLGYGSKWRQIWDRECVVMSLSIEHRGTQTAKVSSVL